MYFKKNVFKNKIKCVGRSRAQATIALQACVQLGSHLGVLDADGPAPGILCPLLCCLGSLQPSWYPLSTFLLSNPSMKPEKSRMLTFQWKIIHSNSTVTQYFVPDSCLFVGSHCSVKSIPCYSTSIGRFYVGSRGSFYCSNNLLENYRMPTSGSSLMV